MNAKKILVMMFILSLLVARGVMQITAKSNNAVNNSTQAQQEISESSEEEISSEATDTDNVEEQLEEQDADDEIDAPEADKEKSTEAENDGNVHEFEGEEELED